MKFNLLVFLLCFFTSPGYCNTQAICDSIQILIPERTFSDSVLYKQGVYYNSNPVSIMLNNMAYCEYKGREISVHVNQNNDSLYIYDATYDIDTRLKLPFKVSIPITGLYFHNYDSIFVFIDRTYVAKMRDYGKEMDDFIMMDSSANVKGRYFLDDIPHIYNGQLDPMIFYSRLSFSGSMIIGNILYIPFGIYRPALEDISLMNLHLKLLCAYDLERKEIKMMNVEFPAEDIGKEYKKDVLTNSFDYYIFDNNTMYISFLYSSDIYKLDLKTNKFECIRQFDDFHFNNIANDTLENGAYRAWFYAPKYSYVNNLFIREIKIDGYKNFKAFSISQVLDENMNLVGYSFEDATWSSFNIDSRGEIVTYKKDDHYLSYRVTGFTNEEMSVEEIENRFLVKKNIQQTKSISIDKTKIDLNDRMIMYLNDLDLSQPIKLVLISSDVLCGHCIEYLMNELKNNKEEFIEQNIKYVFHGTDVMSMVNIINKYHIESRFYYLDTENKNVIYFTGEEMNGYPLVIYQKNKIDIVKTDFSKLTKDFEKFKKKKIRK